MAAQDLRIVFRAAAGPRLGFGHLMRCRSLARALDVSPIVALRGTTRTADVASALGFTLIRRRRDLGMTTRALIVDDPSDRHAGAWVRWAQRHGILAVGVRDLGLGQVPADLIVDGSVRPHRRTYGSPASRKALVGSAFALLDPDIVRWRARRADSVERDRVLIALGGGSHVLALAGQLSDAVRRVAPGARIRVAAGFQAASHRLAWSGAEWVSAPQGLGEELARATVAILAGGVTLYEACAVGTPVVAVALNAPQAITIQAMAQAGVAIDGRSAWDARSAVRVAAHVEHLLAHERSRRRLGAAGRVLVDGRGVFRVADHLRCLLRDRGETRDAA